MSYSEQEYGEVYQRVEGSGKMLMGSGAVLHAKRFTIIQLHSGRVFFLSVGLRGLMSGAGPVEMTGTLLDGREISAELYGTEVDALDCEPGDAERVAYLVKRVLVHGESNASTWTYALTNLVDIAEEFNIEHPLGSARLVRAPDYSHQCRCVRTLFEVRVTAHMTVSANSAVEADKITNDLCLLFTLAFATRVNWISRVGKANAEEVALEFGARITKRFSPSSGVVPSDPSSFVRTCVKDFPQRDEQWGLQTLINAHMDSRNNTDFLELRALKTVVLMEIVKDRYVALESRRESIIEAPLWERVLTRVGDVLREELAESSDELSQVLNNAKGLNRTSFKRLLRAMLQSIGSTLSGKELSWFVTSRNSLVHRGVPVSPYEGAALRGAPFDSWPAEYFWLQHFVGRVLLRLAGFDGECLDLRDPRSSTRQVIRP